MPKNNTMKILKFIGWGGLITLCALLINVGYFKAETDSTRKTVEEMKGDVDDIEENYTKLLQESAKQSVEIENIKKDIVEIKSELKEGHLEILKAISDLKKNGGDSVPADSGG